KCKLNNPDDAKFCQACGGRLIGTSVTPVIHENITDPSVDAESIAIKTIICPHCRKETLPDFDYCVNCGKSLSQTPKQAATFQPSAKEENPIVPSAKEKKDKEEPKKDADQNLIVTKKMLDQEWQVITCPACGKKTRTNLGYCLNCKADLTGKPQPKPVTKPEPEVKPVAKPKPVPKPEVIVQQPEVQVAPKPVPPESVAISTPTPLSGKVVSQPIPVPPPPNKLKIIIPVILVLFLMFIMVVSGILLIKMSRRSASLSKSGGTSEVQPETPKSDPVAIYSVFDTVRDAMLSKDTELLMNCYSPQFPDYQTKLTDTDELIKTYDIVSLTYNIDSPAMKINGAEAELPIKWHIKLRKYDDGSTLTATDSNYVVLVKEENQWKIKQVLQR
ncbi:MAG: zinc ribbon domain-containing protein, partial [bacterium]